MPQAVAIIGSYIGSTVGAYMIMYAVEIATAAIVIGTAAYSNAQRQRAKRAAIGAYNAAQVDRLANVVTTTGKRQLLLGRVRVGGNIFFRGSAGQYKDRFHMALAIAGHEIDAVETVWFNDTALELDADGYVLTEPYAKSSRETTAEFFSIGSATHTLAEVPLGTVKVLVTVDLSDRGRRQDVELPFTLAGGVVTLTGGPWVASAPFDAPAPRVVYEYTKVESYARVQWHLGGADQLADEELKTQFPDLWTDAHRARGVAWLRVDLRYDDTVFATGIPTVSATVRGARCHDPRTGTTAWTQNPAVHARHVLTHPYFGKRTSLLPEEEARIAAAANACDVLHDYGEGPVPLFRSAYVAEYGTAARDVLDDLAQAMGGQWAHAAGQFHLRAGVYSAPVMALSADDLATTTRNEDGSTSSQPIAISVHRARVDKVNSYTPIIWDAAQNSQRATLAPVTSAALVAADGAVLSQELDLPAITHAQQAQHVAGIAMRDARDPLTISATFTLKAWPLELFDVVALTMPRYGWVAKPFMVLSRSLDGQGRISLTLKETAAAIYQPDATFVPSGYAQNTALPDPWNVAPPVLLDPQSGTAHLQLQADGTVLSRVWVSWEPVQDVSVTQAGAVLLQWAPVGAEVLEWRDLPPVTGSGTGAYITGALDGQAIAVRGRCRNSLAVGDWGPLVLHTVLGKTEPPTTVPAVTVSGSQVSFATVADVDLAGYQLRFNYGQDTWWDYATPLHDGLITESPYRLERTPTGLCTVLVKAVDTSGNTSAQPAFFVYAFPEATVANVLESHPQHPAFAGVLTGGVRAGGQLLADAMDSLFDPADAPLYLPSDEAFYGVGQYAPMVYEFAVVATSAGTLRLLLSAVGAYAIQYQTGGADPLFEPGASAMYDPADESLYGTPSAWQTWPGSLELSEPLEVRLRVTMAGGEVQAVISELTAVLDVPDVDEVLSAVAISAAGTRLPITKAYTAIKTVGLTVHSGGSGTSARIVDKNNTLGPLVQVITSTGTAVAGTVDAVIQGY